MIWIHFPCTDIDIMMASRKNMRPMGMVEVIFDTAYLGIGLVLGIYLLTTAGGGAGESGAVPEVRRLYGCMALVLIFGDSFHLIPRILTACSQDKCKFTKQLGAGKMVTSVTMTVFYVILWHVGVLYFSQAAVHSPGSATPMVFSSFWFCLVYALAIIRIGLCLFPQNGWLQAEKALDKNARQWNIYRNIPFAALGAVVMVLFFLNRGTGDVFGHMWIAICLSFGFYVPVVLGAHKYPALGALMLPKTCAYVWMIVMGLGL